MSSQLQVSGEAKIRDIQGPVVANSGVITALDGAASQYVRGDGTLADFPTSSGGGSSVSYYLNSSVSQGTIGGVAYRELSKEPIIGAGTDIAISANGYVASYITDVNDPDVILIPGGNFNLEFYFSVSNDTGNPYTYAELYKYDGTTFTLLGSSVGVPEYITQGTVINPYYFAIPVATATLALTDRLAIRIYVNVDGRTVTLHTENSHLCQVVTTLSKGMVSLNNLTDQSQFITTGTSGTNFAIVSSGDTHTFNLPVASATNTGKLSSTDWSTFNGKVPYTGANANVDLGVYSLTANKLIAGSASTDNVAIFTTYDEGKAIQLKSSTGDLLFVPFFNPATGARIIAQNTTGSAFSPLSFYASTINLNAPLNGTSATFSNNVAQLLSIDSAAIGGSYIALKKQGTLNGAIGMGANTIASNTDTDLGLWATGLIAFQTNSVVRLTIASTGAATFTGSVTASSLVKSGGTSSQFLMADGSVNTSVLPSGAYLPLTGGTLTGALSGTSATFSSLTSGYITKAGASGLLSNSIIYDSGGSIPKIAINGTTITDGNLLNLQGDQSSVNIGLVLNNTNATYPKIYAIQNVNNNLVFYDYSANATRLTISNTGAATFSSSVSGTSIRSSAVGSFGFNTANNGEFQIYGTATDGMLIAGRGSTNDLVLLNKNGGDVLRVPTGTTTVSLQSLTGTGSRAVLADSSGNLSAPVSDISVKENIKPIGYGLNEILKMNPVWFDFIDEYKNYGEGRQNGNIAQEMESIIPEAVFTTPSTGKMGINYDQLHAVYIKAIQELEARIKQLENK